MPLADLVAELSCPVDWTQASVEPELARWLNFLWFARCHAHQVDGEVSALFDTEDWCISDDELGLWNAKEIESALANVRSWVGALREPYRTFSRRFTALVAADRDTYRKHYAPSTSSLSEICALSVQRSASVLLPQVDPALQCSFAWAALDDLIFKHMAHFDSFATQANPKPAADHLARLLERDSLLIAVQACRIIGATDGAPTSFTIIDVDFSTPQFHMYPINEVEYHESKLQAYVQGWNFGLPRAGDA
jgi:hypothetical protein